MASEEPKCTRCGESVAVTPALAELFDGTAHTLISDCLTALMRSRFAAVQRAETAEKSCVECEACGFRYGREHSNERFAELGIAEYTCPLCDITRLTRELAAAREDGAMLRVMLEDGTITTNEDGEVAFVFYLASSTDDLHGASKDERAALDGDLVSPISESLRLGHINDPVRVKALIASLIDATRTTEGERP